MKKEQNCVQCLSKNLNRQKPKRTLYTCTLCSAEMEKPIYLCKKQCFEEYHKNFQNNPVYHFRKNEKKTKKTLKQKRILNTQK